VRTFAGLFVGGAVTLVLFKLFASVIMPVLAMIMGFAFSALKLVLLAVAVYVLYSIFFKRKRRRAEG
jgi:large-conductance mechanosensitive channel